MHTLFPICLFCKHYDNNDEAHTCAAFPEGIPALARRMGTQWAGTTEEERNRDVYVIAHSSYKRDGRLEFIPPSQQRQRGGEEGEERPERYTQFFRMPANGLEEGEDAQQLTLDPWNKSFQGYSLDGRYIIYTVDLGQKEEREEPEMKVDDENLTFDYKNSFDYSETLSAQGTGKDILIPEEPYKLLSEEGQIHP